uniref:Uncharacterized protein n=1 Tax=Candidatus Kentrum sp. LPFa TaxID=2126335 RepID=A0A450X4R9_9GAMM|nr:MAG: hypothetical protein BECKLPF1236B_GA0070989_14013 [Candidatus Kentron sp. LPFa]
MGGIDPLAATGREWRKPLPYPIPILGVMRKILLREEQIDREKEHFWMVGLDVSRRLLFIELVVIGGAYHANIKPAEAFWMDNSGWRYGKMPPAWC